MKNFKISFLLTAALGTLALFGCEQNFDTANLEEEISNTRRLIAKAESDIEELEEDLAEVALQSANAGAATEAFQMLEDEVNASGDLIDSLEPKIKGNLALLQAYQGRFQAKNSFTPGEKLGDFVLKSGIAIKGGTVTKLRGTEIGISHSTGIGYFSVDALPDQFGGRILAGPPKPAAPVDVAAILESKPGKKSDKEVAQTKRTSIEEKLATRQAERAAKLKSEDAEKELRAKATTEVRAVMAQIDAINKAIYQKKRAKILKQRELVGRKVRISTSDQNKQLAPFEQDVAKLERQKADLERLKKDLLSKMR